MERRVCETLELRIDAQLSGLHVWPPFSWAIVMSLELLKHELLKHELLKHELLKHELLKHELLKRT